MTFRSHLRVKTLDGDQFRFADGTPGPREMYRLVPVVTTKATVEEWAKILRTAK